MQNKHLRFAATTSFPGIILGAIQIPGIKVSSIKCPLSFSSFKYHEVRGPTCIPTFFLIEGKIVDRLDSSLHGRFQTVPWLSAFPKLNFYLP